MTETGEAISVLVVDDDSMMRRTIGDLLRLEGYTPVVAASAHEGLLTAGGAPAALAVALVDLRLPDMDGIELIARLRAVSEMIEVVVLTGNASLDSALRALREESYDYLIKPVQPQLLLQSVGRATERWQRRRAESAMRESEDRLRRIFDHVSDALFVTDEQDRVLEANPAGCMLAGLAPTELVGRLLGDVLQPTSSSHGSAGPGSQHEVVRTDGARRVVDAQRTRFAPGQFVHTVRDRTLQRQLEEELLQSRKMDAIGRLAGGIAHDFNNMLTGITCSADLLLEALGSGEESRRDVEEIKAAAKRAAALTGQLLAFSRRQLLQPRLLDLDHVVDAIETMLRRIIGEDIRIVRRQASESWLVLADPGQVEQVVLNLVVNARDAMHDGGELAITTETVRLAEPVAHRHGIVPSGEYVVLRVADVGEGIDDETQGRIFEPFFTTKPAGRGTGLGLSTVYGIVKQSSGHVVVESALGRGTTFSVFLPRAPEMTAEVTAETIAARSRNGTETVLIVEDDVVIRTLARRILAGRGYNVLEAADGISALALAERCHRPADLLLTDVVMPGISGRELTEQLATRWPHMRTLYMTGYTDDEVVRSGVRGAQLPVIQKPFTAELLAAKVREVFDRAKRGPGL